MAAAPHRQGIINADGDIDLGSGDDHSGDVLVITFEAAGGFDGAVSILGRVKGSGLAYAAIDYWDRTAGSPNAVGTITGSRNIAIYGDGLEIQLTTAGRTAGTLAWAMQRRRA